MDWIRIRLLGPGTSLLELSAQISTREVFSCQARIPEDIQEAMDALCVEVGEEPHSAYVLEGDLHPALMLHCGCRPIWWTVSIPASGGSTGVCCRFGVFRGGGGGERPFPPF